MGHESPIHSGFSLHFQVHAEYGLKKQNKQAMPQLASILHLMKQAQASPTIAFKPYVLI